MKVKELIEELKKVKEKDQKVVVGSNDVDGYGYLEIKSIKLQKQEKVVLLDYEE